MSFGAAGGYFETISFFLKAQVKLSEFYGKMMLKNPNFQDKISSSGFLADLLLTMAATILLILIIIFPYLSFQPAAEEISPASERLSTLSYEASGKPLAVLIAKKEGIRLGNASRTHILLDAISEDTSLRNFLAESRQSQKALLLFIEPEGLESAFQLEPLLAAQNMGIIYQIRLDHTCHFVKEISPLEECRFTSQAPTN